MPRAWARAWAASCRRVAEDLARGAAQSFAADHDLGVLLACDVPPAGGVVSPAGVLAVGAAGDDDDGRGDFGVPAADFQPDVFQDLQDRLAAWELLPCADPFWCVCRLPELVLPDHGRRRAGGPVRVPWSRS